VSTSNEASYALAFDLAPLLHSSASAFSACWFLAACFEAAASALRACPCAFFDPSPPPAAPPFFAMLVMKGGSVFLGLLGKRECNKARNGGFEWLRESNFGATRSEGRDAKRGYSVISGKLPGSAICRPGK